MTFRPTRRGLAAGAAVLPAGLFINAAHADSGNESTFERVNRTKQLRMAVVSGSPPYFKKDLATGAWAGAAVEMAKSIAAIWSAEVVYVEFDIRQLRTRRSIQQDRHCLCAQPDAAACTGYRLLASLHRRAVRLPRETRLRSEDLGDLNKPDVRIVFDLGSLHETCARRFAPKAQLTGYKTIDDCILALQSGRADAEVLAATIGLSTVGKNPSLGPYHLLSTPTVSLPSCYGVQREPDTRFVEVVNAWIDFNRGIGTIRDQMIGGLALNGVTPEQVPAELSF